MLPRAHCWPGLSDEGWQGLSRCGTRTSWVFSCSSAFVARRRLNAGQPLLIHPLAACLHCALSRCRRHVPTPARAICNLSSRPWTDVEDAIPEHLIVRTYDNAPNPGLTIYLFPARTAPRPCTPRARQGTRRRCGCCWWWGRTLRRGTRCVAVMSPRSPSPRLYTHHGISFTTCRRQREGSYRLGAGPRPCVSSYQRTLNHSTKEGGGCAAHFSACACAGSQPPTTVPPRGFDTHTAEYLFPFTPLRISRRAHVSTPCPCVLARRAAGRRCASRRGGAMRTS